MDSMTSHKDEAIREKFKVHHDTILDITPAGLMKKLQPLDITVNRVFKLHIRQAWEIWMSKGLHEYTATGRMKRATYGEVCGWVLDAWEAVKATTIINGFIKAKIIQGSAQSDDNIEDTDSSRLREEMGALFCSDSEDEDFEGFQP